MHQIAFFGIRPEPDSRRDIRQEPELDSALLHSLQFIPKFSVKDNIDVLYVQCWNTVKVWKITIQHVKLSGSLSGSLPPERDIKNGRISGKLEPDIRCIPRRYGPTWL